MFFSRWLANRFMVLCLQQNDEEWGSEQPIQKYPNTGISACLMKLSSPLCLLVEGNKEDNRTSVHLVRIRMEELVNELRKKKRRKNMRVMGRETQTLGF